MTTTSIVDFQSATKLVNEFGCSSVEPRHLLTVTDAHVWVLVAREEGPNTHAVIPTMSTRTNSAHVN